MIGKVQLLDPKVVGEMLVIKNKVIERIKELVKVSPIKNAEINIFSCATGKKLTIESVYVDPIEETLTLRTSDGVRVYVTDVLNENEPEDQASLILTISELTKIITFMENKINERNAKINAINELAESAGVVIEIKQQQQ